MRDARPTIADLRTLVRRTRRRTTTSPTCCGKAPRARAGRQAGVRATRSQALQQGHAGPRVHPALHAGPRRLAARLRPGRGELRRQRPLRAHPADLQRLLVHRQPGRRHAHADPAEPAPRRPADRQRPALPGRGLAAAGRRLGAVPRHRRHPRLRPEPRAPRPMKRLLAIASRARSPPRVLRRLRHRRGRRRRRHLPGARDLRRTPSRSSRARTSRSPASRSARSTSLDVTPDHKAAVVLRIDRARLRRLPRGRRVHDPPAVADRREVRRVHADPAAARGAPAAADAAQDRARARARASTCCRSRRRRKPVDLDLVNNIAAPALPRSACRSSSTSSAPALAGRGGDLRQAIRNANPALKETDKVLRDPRRPEPRARRPGPRLATRSSRPLARDRAQGRRLRRRRPNTTRRRRPSAASALEQNIAKLPAFLRELTPDDAAPRRLRRPDDAGARPTSASRGARRSTASSRQLGPFSQAGDPGAASRSATPPTSAARR